MGGINGQPKSRPTFPLCKRQINKSLQKPILFYFLIWKKYFSRKLIFFFKKKLIFFYQKLISLWIFKWGFLIFFNSCIVFFTLCCFFGLWGFLKNQHFLIFWRKKKKVVHKYPEKNLDFVFFTSGFIFIFQKDWFFVLKFDILFEYFGGVFLFCEVWFVGFWRMSISWFLYEEKRKKRRRWVICVSWLSDSSFLL